MLVSELDSAEAEEREILDDPEVRKALAALDNPEDREDLIDALIIQKRIDEGKETTTPWEDVKTSLMDLNELRCSNPLSGARNP